MIFFRDTGREGKASKIEAVIKDFTGWASIEHQRLLDVGCGGGGIGAYFSLRNEVHGVDVENRILPEVRQKIVFTKIIGSRFPYGDSAFDIVISNHVIEHAEDQAGHLAEIFRVLKPGGICYIATPNRNFPIEPHYRIPLIHYLPEDIFHRLLKFGGRYRESIFLLSYATMVKMYTAAGFHIYDYTALVLSDPKKFKLGISFTKHIPKKILELFRRISPTNIFILKKEP